MQVDNNDDKLLLFINHCNEMMKNIPNFHLSTDHFVDIVVSNVNENNFYQVIGQLILQKQDNTNNKITRDLIQNICKQYNINIYDKDNDGIISFLQRLNTGDIVGGGHDYKSLEKIKDKLK